MEDVLKQCLRRKIKCEFIFLDIFVFLKRKETIILNCEVFVFNSLTLDKCGFWEYLDIFSRDRFIKGPSGFVNMEAWRKSKRKVSIFIPPIFNV